MERNPYFDNARFIIVVLVVFGHLLSPHMNKYEDLEFINTFLSLFRMPALIMISGYFAAMGFEKDGHIAKVAKRLLFPYLIFQIIFGYYYFELYQKEQFSVDLFMPWYTLWYLLSLFCWHLMLFIFSRLKHSLLIAVILGVGIGYIEEAGHYFSISRTFVFFPYFLLGYHLQKNGFYFEWVEKIKTTPYRIAGVLAGVFSAGILYYFMNHNTRSWVLGRESYDAMGYGDWWIGFYRILFYLLSLAAGYAFLIWIPKKKMFFTHLGRRTAYIYVFHGAIIKWIYTKHWDAPFDSSGEFIIIPAVAIGLSFLLGSKLVKILTAPLVECTIPNEWKTVDRSKQADVKTKEVSV